MASSSSQGDDASVSPIPLRCLLPEYPSLKRRQGSSASALTTSSPDVTCFGKLLVLTRGGSNASGSAKPLEYQSCICAAVSGGVGLLGCQDGRLFQWNSATGATQPITVSNKGGGAGSSSGGGFVLPTFGTFSSSSAGAGSSSASTGRIEVRRVFRQGSHSLVSLSNGDHAYYRIGSTCRVIQSLKDLAIRATCFIDKATGMGPGVQLLSGTQEGCIHSTFVPNTFMTSSDAPPTTQLVLTLPSTHKSPIVNICTHQIDSPSTNSSTLSIIVTTVNALFHFVGSGSATPEQILVQQPTSADTSLPSLPNESAAHKLQRYITSRVVFEVPRDHSTSQLHITDDGENLHDDKIATARSGDRSGGKTLWWLTGVGLLVSRLIFQSNKGHCTITSPPLLIPFPAQPNNPTPLLPYPAYSPVPSSFAVTPDHLLFQLDNSRVSFVSRITKRQVSVLSFPPVQYGQTIQLIADAEALESACSSQDTSEKRSDIYLVTSRFIINVGVKDAHKGLWRDLYSIKDYPAAIKASLADRQSPGPASLIPSYLQCEYGKSKLTAPVPPLPSVAKIFSECRAIPVEDLYVLFDTVSSSSSTSTVNDKYLCLVTLLAHKQRQLMMKHEQEAGGAFGTAAKTTSAIVLLSLAILSMCLKALNKTEFHLGRLRLQRKRNSMTSKRGEGVPSSAVAISEKEFGARISQLMESYKTVQHICSEVMLNLKNLLMTDHAASSVDGNVSIVTEICEVLGRHEGKESEIWAEAVNDLDTLVRYSLYRHNVNQAIDYIHQYTEKCDNMGVLESIISRYGVLLFHRAPSSYVTLFTAVDNEEHEDDLDTISSPPPSSSKLSSWINGAIKKNAKKLSFLIPVLLTSLCTESNSNTTSPLNYPFKQLVDTRKAALLSRSEAIRMLSYLLPIDSPQKTPTPTPVQPGSKGGGTRGGVGSWDSVSGLTNLLYILLASCVGTENALLKRLSLQDTSMKSRDGTLDPHLLLKYCYDVGATRALPLLLALAGMYRDAVDVALYAKDLTLAKFVVRKASHVLPAGKQRSIWQKIASKAATILEPAELLALLGESDGVLRLHENLDFMSKLSVVGAFHQELCRAFDGAEERLREKQADIEHNVEALAYFKTKLKMQRVTAVPKVIDDKTLCLLCRRPVHIDRFYIFPCSHAIHTLCAHRLKAPLLQGDDRLRYKKAVTRLCEALLAPNKEGGEIKRMLYDDVAVIDGRITDKWDQSERVVDETLASECYLCGSYAVQMLEMPVLTDGEWNLYCESIAPPSPLHEVNTSPNDSFPTSFWIINRNSNT